MSDELARKRFTEFNERTDRSESAELDEFWATLEPATIDDMIGEWKGGEFDTGHPVINALDTARWFGKTFRSAADVKPLICLDDDGNKFSNTELGNGEATPVDGGVPRRAGRDDGLRRPTAARPLQEDRRQHGHGHHERQARADRPGQYGYFYLERV